MTQTPDAATRDTMLSFISTKSLTVTCRDCGHAKTVKLAEIIPHMRPDARLSDLRGRLKCSSCKSKQIGEMAVVAGLP